MMRAGLSLVMVGGFLLVNVANASAQAPQRPSTPQIDKAVTKGIAFLRNHPWDYSTEDKPSGNMQYDAGAAALIALALLESDVPAKDPALVAAARAIRNYSPKLTKTYAISLTILFLDRYGGSAETETIRDLAYRLVAGQDATSWGWGYDCPIVKDHRAILGFLQQNKNRTDFGKWEPTGKACNSNTQFAIVALWVARRHNVPADFILARAEARFRNTQHKDGGWGYHHDTEGSGPSMTCSGLIGLAIGYGNRQASLQSGGRIEDSTPNKNAPKEDIRKDPMVEKGKEWLAGQLKRKPHEIGHWPYFLWSLERVGVVYGFTELGKVDWYDWGTASLIERQKEDGSWDGGYPPQVNTAFALLFLRKANLAKDLSGLAQLKAQGGKDVLANNAGEVRPEAMTDAARLARELPQANAARQKEILKTLEETKDPTGTYTEELLGCISGLTGAVKDQARQALAARLSRQSVNALRGRMDDGDNELRLAVVRAAGLKGSPELAADLVGLVEDKDQAVAAAAQNSLKQITKQDLGKNAQAWREYLAKLKR
jgi:hypothetical protein